jgi:autotransporter-associated beta strand protein
MSKFKVRRWLRSLLRDRPPAQRAPARRRLRFDSLEDRLAPAVFTWTGGAGAASNIWGLAQNWSNNAAPGNGADLLFPAGVSVLTTVNNLTDLFVNSITISGTGYTLQGNPITLGSLGGGAGFVKANGVALNDTIDLDGITLGGGVGDRQFFTVNSNTSVLTLHSPLIGTLGGELSKDGTGTLILSGNNSGFTGPISVVEGELNARTATALGDTSNPTTVLFDSINGKFGQLQVEDVAGAIAEPLILNGAGPLNDGALLNVDGDNLWTGLVTLDSNSTVGANAGSLTIQGVITDLGAGHSLTKEGPATITLDPINAPGTPAALTGNSYRGQTIINNGILAIRHSLALGNDTTPVVGVNDTVVNSFTNRSGALQLEFVANPLRIDPNVNATNDGFTVPSEALTLNGPGVEGIHVLPKDYLQNGGDTVTGALNNLSGNNTWAQNISLWSGDTAMLFDPIFWDFPTVGIGAEVGAQLTIAGHVNDNLISGSPTLPAINYSLIKTRPGRVVLVHDDSYRGLTEVLAGFLNIRDSAALGATGSANNGTVVFPQGTLELEADNIPDSNPAGPAPDGTSHLNTDIVIGSGGEQLSLMGTGAGGNGALRNIRGTNEDTGDIPLRTFIGRGTSSVTFFDSGATVGVQPDQAPFDQFHLSQLTLSGAVSNGNLTKVGAGELVLTNANSMNQTVIQQGWITARDNLALGPGSFPDTLTPATYVAEGAALVLKQTRAASPQNITVPERLFLSGDGITHRFPELNHKGALLNLSGDNVATGIINLVGTGTSAMVGIGADIANSPWVPADANVTTSTLTLTNLMQELGQSANLAIQPAPPNTLVPAGINKLGRKRVLLQGQGTFTGDNQVSAGVLRLQSDTALGMLAGTTSVLNGAALELTTYASTIPPSSIFNDTFNGGLTGGIQVFETLVLNGSGNVTANDPTHGLTSPQPIDTLTSLTDDNQWRGPITFASNVNIDAETDSRLSLWKSIDGPGGFTKNGAGELVLGGVNSYNGVTTISKGSVNLQSSSALGSSVGGTVVANNAQLEFQGDITIGGESLTVLGNGPDTAPNLPLRWFAEGPSPILNGQTIGNDSVTGRVTGVVVDPNDTHVLYVSAAGGGLWRSKNDGATWQPLIDNINGTPVDPTKVIFTGAVAVAPTDSSVIYVGLGESNNSGDSYYGRGILKSTDWGATWTLMTPPAGNPFDRRTVSKIVVDPARSDVIYVALCSDGVNGLGAGNNGIWRFNPNTNPQWINLPMVTSPVRLTAGPNGGTAGPGPDDDNNILFSGNDQYTDVVVLQDTRNANNRFVIFNVGNSGGVVRSNPNLATPTPTGINGTYISINVPVGATTGWSWFRQGMTVSDGNFAHNGMMKTAAAYNPNNLTYAIYSASTWPTNNPGGPGLPQFRQIWKDTITWNGAGWTLNSWATTQGQPGGNYMGNQGDYDTVIGVEPDNINYVFVAGIGQPFTTGPYVTTDGGNTWTDIGNTLPNSPHVDYHAVAWEGRLTTSYPSDPGNPQPHLIVGNDGGIWRLQNGTPGQIQWTDLNANNAYPNNTSFLQLTQFNGLDVSPTDPFFAVGASQDNGTEIYNDNPAWTHVEDGDGGVVQINNVNPNVIFHVLNGTLRRSIDGGNTWTTINGVGGGLYFPFILDRVNPSRLLAPSGANLRESMNSDTTATFNTIGSFGGTILAIGVADRQGVWANDALFPSAVDNGKDSYDSDTVYVLVTDGVHVTKNHGSTYQLRNNGLTLSGTSDLVVDPRNRDTAYVTRSVFGGGHVFQTTNAGQTWTDISGNLPNVPTWSVVVNSRNGDIYVGTDIGVYYLPGGTGTTWSRLGVGLPAVQVQVLVFNAYTNMLSAGTYGRGLFQVWLDDSAANSGALRAITGSAVWHGPVTLVGNVDFRAETGAQLEISGVISDNVAGDNWTINKVGPGKFIFSGNNTYGGITDVQQGVLNTRNVSALGSAASKTTVEAGAALEIQADLALETVELNGDGININGHNTGALRNVSNANTFTGTVVLLTDSTIGVDSGSQLTVGTKATLPGTGTITDNGGNRQLTKELTGTLVLASANTYGGKTEIIQGALQVQHALALGGTANGTDVSNGAQIQMQTPLAGQPVVVSGEALTLSGTGIFGTGAILNTGGDNVWRGPITLESTPGIPAPPPATPPNHVAFGANANSSLTVNAVINENGGSFGFDKVGLGKVILQGADTYSGVTTVYAGVLNIQNAGALGTTGGGTVVITGAALELQDPLGGGISFAAEPLTINGPGAGAAPLGALRNVQGNNTWSGTVTLATNSAIGADAASQLTVAGVNRVGSAAAVTLTKVGPGALVFAGDNANLLGPTQINSGVLQIQSAHGLGPVGSQPTTVASGASLQLYNVANPVADEGLTINGPGFNGLGALENVAGSNTWSRTINLGSNSAIGVDGAADILTINAAIVDPGGAAAFGVTKVGPGTLQYAGAAPNTYDGLTQVNQGVLLLAKTAPFAGNLTVGDNLPPIQDDSAIVRDLLDNEIPDGAITIINQDGLLDINSHVETINTINVLGGHASVGNGALTTTNLTMQDGLVNTANGSVTVTNLNMTGGTITLAGAAGTLNLAGDVVATSSATPQTAEIGGAGSVQLGGVSRAFNVADGAPANPFIDLQIDAAIAGTGSEGIFKTGAGVMDLAAVNTYTGTSEIDAGTLLVDGRTGDVHLNGGTLGGNGTINNNDATGLGGVVSPGDSPGILNATGTVTWNNSVTFFVELNDAAAGAGVGYDQLQVLVPGSINLNNAQIGGLVGAGVVIGDSFTIITAPLGSVSGKFADSNGVQLDDAFVGGQKFHIVYASDHVTLTRERNNVSLNIVATANPSVWGQDITYTVTVTPEVGGGAVPLVPITFQFTSGPGGPPPLPGVVTKTLVSNPPVSAQATYNPFADSNSYILQVTAPGNSYVLTVSFPQTPDFNSASATFTQNVNKANTVVGLSASPSPAPFGATVTLTGDVDVLAPGGTVTGSNDLTGGTITFAVDGVPQAPIVVNAAGVATLDVTGLNVGGHVFSATYSGDAHFNGSFTPADVPLQVVRADTSTSVTGAPNPSDPGQDVTFTAHVTSATGIPNGNVVFLDGNNSFATVPVNGSGFASFTISTLPPGIHTINAQYSGSTNYNASSGITTQVVKAFSTVTVGANPNPSRVGQQVTLTATVQGVPPVTSTPTGNVDFFNDGNPIGVGVALNGSGVATLPYTFLTAGAHVITARYNGNPTYEANTGTLSPNQQVNAADTTTTLTKLTASPSVYGQPVSFSVTVAAVLPGGGAPSGQITFFDGANSIGTAPLTNGAASFQISTLPAGTTHSITARFDGNTNYVTSTSAPVSQTVNKADTTAVLAVSPNPSVYGQAAITVTVTANNPGSGVPDGNVTFTITNLQSSVVTHPTASLNPSGIATLSPPLGVGTYSISAAYTGSANYNASNTNVINPVTINKADSTTALTTSGSPGVFGSVVITATVAPALPLPGGGTPTGSVVFHVSGGTTPGDYIKALSGGVATLQGLGTGTYTITADYSGDDNFKISSGTLAGGQIINLADSQVDVASNHNPSRFGQSVTFTATVSANPAGSSIPTGTVDFYDGATLIAGGRPINTSGQAFFTTSTLDVAGSPHTISAVYTGSTNFNGNTGVLSGGQVVNKGDVAGTVSATANPALLGDTVNFNASFSAQSPAAGAINGTADLFIDGVERVSNQSVVNGAASFSFTDSVILAQGPHNILVHFDSNNNFNAGDSTVTVLTVKGNTNISVGSNFNPSVSGQTVTFTATVTPASPASGALTGTVNFVIDGGTVASNLSLDNFGQVTFQTSALTALGSPHSVVAHYNGDPIYFAGDGSLTGGQVVNKASSSTAVSQSSTSSMFGDMVTFTATVSAAGLGSGVPGGQVQFIIDGGSPIVRTLQGGAASIQISSLDVAGSPHTVHVDYAGDNSFLASSGDLNPDHTVTAAGTTTVVTSSLNPSVFAQNVVFTATVSAVTASAGAPTGSVTFTVDGSPIGPITLSGGLATFSTSTLAIGPHTITAAYASDSINFANSTSASFQQTVKANPAVFAVVPASVKSGAGFTVVVVYKNGANVDTTFNGPVTLQLNSGPAGGGLNGQLTVNAQAGVATFTGLTLNKAGLYTLAASANGLPPVVSSGINVTASFLTVAVTPARVVATKPFVLSLFALDVTGGLATNYAGAFFLKVLRKPAGAVITGPRVGIFNGGIGALRNLKVSKPGPYVFRLFGPGGLYTTIRIVIAGRRAS